MTTQWATKTLPHDAQGNVILLQHEGGAYQAIDPATFAAITDNTADASASYAALSANALIFDGTQVTPVDAGWQQYFDAWKSAGYVD